MLSDTERQVLAGMSVFRGGFDLKAAERVAGASLAVLASLADKSLIQVDALGRYDLHELLRQYLATKLADHGETGALTDRHLDFYSKLADNAEAHLHGPEQETWFDRLEIEHDNLRAALAWSIRDGRVEAGMRMAGALGFFWELRSHWYEGHESLTRLVDHTTDVPAIVRAKALRFATIFAEYGRELRRARAYCEESVALARASSDPASIAWALCAMGLYVETPVNPDGAVALFLEALALFREVGEAFGISHTLRRLGIVLMLRGEYARARPLIEEALAGAREAADQNALAWSLFLFGNVVWLQDGDVHRATSLLEEALSLSPRIRDWSHHMWVQFTLGAAARVQGNYTQAQTRYQEVVALMRDKHVSAYLNWPELLAGAVSGLGRVAVAQSKPALAAQLFGAASHVPDPEPPMFFRVDREHDAAAARQQLGDAAYEAAFRQGQAMTTEQTIALALRRKGRRRS